MTNFLIGVEVGLLIGCLIVTHRTMYAKSKG